MIRKPRYNRSFGITTMVIPPKRGEMTAQCGVRFAQVEKRITPHTHVTKQAEWQWAAEQIPPINRTQRTLSAGPQKILADRLVLLYPFSVAKFLQDFFVLEPDMYLQVCQFLQTPFSPVPRSLLQRGVKKHCFTLPILQRAQFFQTLLSATLQNIRGNLLVSLFWRTCF